MRNALKFLLIAGLLVGLVGCTIDNPVDAPMTPHASVVKHASQPFALPAGTGLQKAVKVSGLVTVAEGGQLAFEHSSGTFAVKIVLTFGPGSVANDIVLDMVTDDEILAATFGPEGTRFLKPGNLYVEAHGLALPGQDAAALANALKLLYENEATGEWEPIQANGFNVDVATGSVTCTNGVINHFSRYGFGI